MKGIIIFLLCLVGTAYGQTTGYFRYDTTRFQKGGGNNELYIENATRGVTGGVFTNQGNGRGAWVLPGALGTNLTGNLAWVDDVNGNDGTGTLGNASLPYLTLMAAVTDATAGYTIIVRPGTYDFEGNTLLKNNVNWYFMPGAIISGTALSSETMFTDNSGAITSNITGYGQFIDTLGGVSKILDILNADSNIYFECQSAIVGNGDIDQTISVTDGVVNANIRGNVESLNYDAIVVTGGTLNLTADLLLGSSAGGVEGNGVEIDSGYVNIRCREIRSKGIYDVAGSSDAISYGGGTVIIEANVISELADGLHIHNTIAGTLAIRGKITSTSRTAVSFLSGATNKDIILQSTLVSNTSFDSIDAPAAQTVVSYGAFANRVYDANITINGTITIGSYVK